MTSEQLRGGLTAGVPVGLAHGLAAQLLVAGAGTLDLAHGVGPCGGSEITGEAPVVRGAPGHGRGSASLASMRDPTKEEPPLEREIRHEKARTLGKAGEALEHAAALAWERHRAAETGEQGAAEAYRAAYEAARERRHRLLLQREALGLFRHGDVDRCYPLPPPPVPGMDEKR